MKMDDESDKEEAEMLVESIFSKNSAAEKFEIKPQKTSPEQIDKILPLCHHIKKSSLNSQEIWDLNKYQQISQHQWTSSCVSNNDGFRWEGEPFCLITNVNWQVVSI